jgi:hypothetical protein
LEKGRESLGPYLYWTIGGTRCGSSSIPDIIRIRQGSWKGYLGSDQGLLDINFPHHFLPPVFAPRLLGEIVCVTNEICLCLIDGHFTSVDMSGNLSEPAAQ